MTDVGQLIREAVAHARAGRLAAAAEPSRKALELDPQRPEPHLFIGLAAAQAGRAEEAADHLEQYLARRPEDRDAWYNLGVMRQQLRRWPDAVAAYQHVLESSPDHVPARINAAECLRETGQAFDAIQLLAAADRDPRIAAALARHRRLDGQPRRAVDGLQHRDDLTQSAGLRAELARCLQAAGDPDGALEQWSAAAGLAPDDAAVAVGMAHARHSAGETEPARETLKRFVEQHPRAATAWNALAVLEQQSGSVHTAIEAAGKAVELAPGQPGFLYNQAAILSKRTNDQELRQSEQAARQCLALQPGHADAWHCLGLVLAKLGQSDAATRALEKAVELAGPRSDLAVSLGDHRAVSGDLEQAISGLEAAAAANPDAAVVHRQLGVQRLKQQQAEAALAALDRALELEPRDQRSIAHRAVALQHLGRHREAEAYLGFDRHIERCNIAPPPGFETREDFNRRLADDIRNHSLLRWEPKGLAARNGALTEELMADRTPAIVGFEQRLREAIEALRERSRPDPRDPFLQAIPEPGYELNIWATLVHGGGHIDTHIHEESWLSGAYYVHLPDTLGADPENPEGWIEFGRPHAEIPLPGGARIETIRPETGLLILFPSYLFHRTLPHTGDEERISISFDLVPRS